jgi:hypothetical protein
MNTGFYANDIEVFYLSDSGKLWLVASPDDFAGEAQLIAENVFGLAPDMVPVDHLLTPDEADSYCRMVERESGETID